MFFVYFLLSIILLIYVYFKKSYSFWRDRGFLYLEPSIPMGNMGTIGFKEHLCEFMMREYKNFKNKASAFGMYMFVNPALVVIDPELIKEVNVTSFEHFHERGLYVNEEADPLWKNLFTTDGQEWKDLRAKLSPTFTSGRMKMMFPIVIQTADRMTDYLKKLDSADEGLEMKEIFASFTTETIASVAFGLETECLGNPDNQFRQMAKHMFEPSKWENVKILLIFTMPKIAKILNMGVNPKHVVEFFTGIIRENMEYRKKNNVRRNDFFQLLLDLKDSENGLTFNEIAANSFIFFGAGFETSSSVMTFCTYELALNQDIQDRLRKEIETVLKAHNGSLTYEAIAEMKYLDMVFNETIRRYPVIDTQIRRCAKDFPIPKTNLVVPAGAMILIPVVALQNDEEFFENPEKFDPERFTEENVRKIRPHTFIPFSEGPRICIGLRFGTMQAKIGLVKILRTFKILPCEKTLIPMKYSPTSGFQSPLGGMWLKLEKLN